MKNSILILVFLASTMYVSAQEIPKQKEVGIAFRSLDNFGLTFKTGTEKSIWRFNGLALNGNNISQEQDSLKKIGKHNGFSIGIGKEFRKEVAENLEFRYGADFTFSNYYSYVKVDDLSIENFDQLDKSVTYEPRINLVLGLNYAINNKLVVGVEVLPGVSYTTGTTTRNYIYQNTEHNSDEDISGFHYGFSTNSALLTLACRF